MRKEWKSPETVGELKAYLADVPDNTPLARRTNGHYQVIVKRDVSFFVGKMEIGRKEENLPNEVVLLVGMP